VLVLTGGVPAPGAAPVGPPPLRPAVWAWALQPPADLRDFARAHHLSEVFLATPVAPSDQEREQIRRTVQLLHDDGVRVAALGGDVAWVRHHDQALDWARAALATADFDGLHLDVEPHGLPGWHDPDTRRVLIREYLGLLQAVRPLSRRIVVDVQFAYGSYDAPG